MTLHKNQWVSGLVGFTESALRKLSDFLWLLEKGTQFSFLLQPTVFLISENDTTLLVLFIIESVEDDSFHLQLSNKTMSYGVFSSFLAFKMFSKMSIIYSLCKNGLVDIIKSVSENREIFNIEDRAE